MFLDPNLKLSQLILCVVHTLCILLYYHTSALVTWCDPGSLSLDMRPTAGVLVQRHLAGKGRNSSRGEMIFPQIFQHDGFQGVLKCNIFWYNIFLCHSFQSDMFLPTSCALFMYILALTLTMINIFFYHKKIKITDKWQKILIHFHSLFMV